MVTKILSRYFNFPDTQLAALYVSLKLIVQQQTFLGMEEKATVLQVEWDEKQKQRKSLILLPKTYMRT